MAKLTPAASRGARGMLKWSVRQLAKAAGVSPTTISQLENGRDFHGGTEDKIKAALELEGIEITNGDGTGVRFRKTQPPI